MLVPNCYVMVWSRYLLPTLLWWEIRTRAGSTKFSMMKSWLYWSSLKFQLPLRAFSCITLLSNFNEGTYVSVDSISESPLVWGQTHSKPFASLTGNELQLLFGLDWMASTSLVPFICGTSIVSLFPFISPYDNFSAKNRHLLCDLQRVELSCMDISQRIHTDSHCFFSLFLLRPNKGLLSTGPSFQMT